MNARNQRKLDLFLENFQEIKGYLPMRLGFARSLAALRYSMEGRRLEVAPIEAVRGRLDAVAVRQNAFRHAADLLVWSELALSEAREALIEQASEAYRLLREAHFSDARLMAFIALQMAAALPPERFPAHVELLRRFRRGMQFNQRLRSKRHASLLASQAILNGAQPERLNADTLVLQALAKGRCSVQLRPFSALEILAQDGEAERALARYAALAEACKRRRIAVANRYCPNSLALLSLLPGAADETARELSEMGAYLRAAQGFNEMYCPGNILLILLAPIYLSTALEEGRAGEGLDAAALRALSGSVLALADDRLLRGESSN